MIKAAVLGSPISHSLSPALHKRAYELLGVVASGFSLTMPLKEKIFGLMDLMDFRIDSEATRMRSANTLVVEKGGFRATSTDRTGFIRLFDGLARKRVAIIGGGGTARAALAALEGAATTVDFLLRSSARTEILAKVAISTEVNFFGMDHSLRGYDLVIATVPSGVSDLIAATLDFPIPAFCEVLYNPFPTALLAKARSLGSRTMDGIDLLVEQALDQVKLFSKQNFEFEAMRGELQAIGRAHLH
jgi:shikimate dehydrogenase